MKSSPPEICLPPAAWVIPRLVLLGMVLLLAGCAGVSHRAIDTQRRDQSARGFRYYDSSLYLLVQTNNEGGLVSKLEWLPDQTKLRHAKPYKFLAKNETTLEFTNGVLAKSDSVGDGTIIPKAFIEAAEKVVTAGIKSGAAMDDPTAERKPLRPDRAPPVYLFKIVQVDGQYLLLGDEGCAPQYLPASR